MEKVPAWFAEIMNIAWCSYGRAIPSAQVVAAYWAVLRGHKEEAIKIAMQRAIAQCIEYTPTASLILNICDAVKKTSVGTGVVYKPMLELEEHTNEGGDEEFKNLAQKWKEEKEYDSKKRIADITAMLKKKLEIKCL